MGGGLKPYFFCLAFLHNSNPDEVTHTLLVTQLPNIYHSGGGGHPCQVVGGGGGEGEGY